MEIPFQADQYEFINCSEWIDGSVLDRMGLPGSSSASSLAGLCAAFWSRRARDAAWNSLHGVDKVALRALEHYKEMGTLAAKILYLMMQLRASGEVQSFADFKDDSHEG